MIPVIPGDVLIRAIATAIVLALLHFDVRLDPRGAGGVTAPMDAPELDVEGYPTEATLEAVRHWQVNGFADAERLLRFVQQAWWGGKDFCRPRPRRVRDWPGGPLERRWDVHTVGWSGNESLIGALHDNYLFWMFCFESERRGGHFEFRTRA